jgi:hypothetical protein
MTIFHQVLGCVGKRNVGIQIAPLLAESLDPTICRKAVIVACVTDYEGRFMDRGIISFNHLLKVLFREVSLNSLGRGLITCFEDVDAFCKHRVY